MAKVLAFLLTCLSVIAVLLGTAFLANGLFTYVAVILIVLSGWIGNSDDASFDKFLITHAIQVTPYTLCGLVLIIASAYYFRRRNELR